MANPFYNALYPAGVQQAPVQNGGNLLDMARQLKANPLTFILQKRLNIPMNLMNNPDAMLNHLVSSGQIPQSRVDWAKQQMAQNGFT